MKKEIIAELKLELQMRRNVWPKIKGKSDTFIKIEHQDRYATMENALRIFQAMTDAEFNKFTSIINKPPVDQGELF